MSAESRDRLHDDHHSRDEGALVLSVVVVIFLALAGYILVHRFHLRLGQVVELAVYFLGLVAGIAGALWYFTNRNRRIENTWPHPPVFIPMLQDQACVEEAFQQNAIVLGYDDHRRPWLWSDEIRALQSLLVGLTGAGKTTLLKNIISQDLRRSVGPPGNRHRIPMVIIDGKGDVDFLKDLLPDILAAGRLHQLRVLDPSRPEISIRYNPCYSPDGAYLDHASLIFESFGLEEDFFKGHQASYFNNLSRVLWHTGKRYSIRDILIMAIDEQVMRAQVQEANVAMVRRGVSRQQKDNFDMSVHLLQKSLEDRERVVKIQGLLDRLMTFLDDDLSLLTGSYEDLLTLDEIIDQELILFVSLNTNRNPRAETALGRMLLQNLQLMIGKRYETQRESRPLLSVILDEFTPFAYPNFAQILQTARGANAAFIFSLQSIPQLLKVGSGFQQDIVSAPNTVMVMHTNDDVTARYFCQASSRIPAERKTMKVERKGLLAERLEQQDEGSVTEVEKTRVKEFHIKNLPQGQMQILQTDRRLGTLHAHLHVRCPAQFQLPTFEPMIYPSLETPYALSQGAKLQFRNQEFARIHGRKPRGL